MTLLEQLCYAQNEAYKTPKSTMRQVGRRIKTAALIESYCEDNGFCNASQNASLKIHVSLKLQRYN